MVTGPLGAGKTTLVNRFLNHRDFANSAVILNEFGEVALEGERVERADDGVIALGAGCICCAVRGELVDALERLLRDLDNDRVATISRVIIEAAAAADPAAILTAVARHPYLSLRYRADGIVAVIDAGRFEALLAADADLVRQVAMADVVAVSRGDAAGSAEAGARLARLKNGADLVDAATVAPSVLIGRGAFDPATTTLAGWFGASHCDHASGTESGEASRIHAFTVARDRPIAIVALERFLDYLAGLQGHDLLRVKGVVTTGDGEAIVVEGIGALFYPPLVVVADGESQPATRMRVVARDLDRATFETYLDAFLNEPRIDTPDRHALVDSPLTIAGFSARRGR